jgi:hypothetical protein
VADHPGTGDLRANFRGLIALALLNPLIQGSCSNPYSYPLALPKLDSFFNSPNKTI